MYEVVFVSQFNLLDRCVKKDLGYVGCSSDVLTAMDYMCSGLRQCDFRVPELDVLVDPSRMTCMDELVKYLEASYECIKGTCNIVSILHLSYAQRIHETSTSKINPKTHSIQEM